MTGHIHFARSTSLVVGLALVPAAAWWWTAPPAPAHNVVVITLDTTRADHLSPYGYMNVSLPSLERLAGEGVVFDRAISVAPLTLPAHTTLFTGLLPPRHGVRDNAVAALAESQTTLAERLRARGFRTGAFVGSVVVGPERGLAQGFDQYVGVPSSSQQTPDARQRRADDVMGDAIRWLDSTGSSPFLLWAHLYDAHRPYDPPEPYRTTYGHNLYVGEIAFMDAQIGRLLGALEARGLLENTVVIVVADHGESLGAHGERDHGIFLYEEVLRVPMIVRAPGVQPIRVADVVRLTDVMPTILELLRLPPAPVDGVSLVGLMRGRPSDRSLEAYAESLYPERLGWAPLRALRDEEFKFINAPRPELYDLANDPYEEQNLYESRQTVAVRLAARLAALTSGRASLSAEDRPGSTPEWRAQLASLGYVASAPPAPAGRPLPDPKDCIGTYGRTPAAMPARPGCGPVSPMQIASGR